MLLSSWKKSGTYLLTGIQLHSAEGNRESLAYHLDLPCFIVQVIFLRTIAEVLKKLSRVKISVVNCKLLEAIALASFFGMSENLKKNNVDAAKKVILQLATKLSFQPFKT